MRYKKIISVVIILVLIAGLMGCRQQNTDTEKQPAQQSAPLVDKSHCQGSR